MVSIIVAQKILQGCQGQNQTNFNETHSYQIKTDNSGKIAAGLLRRSLARMEITLVRP
jgi:hypothetical protein